ncbi:Uncharacterized protein C824.03c, mitochondrial [Taphrina deformans PYCC 5710]|uniref:Uncharacterized protein C824.03c, mitochondrial n=1 Tax=Taphrina deformans (strain PYCC 5710 / ATCC 11124 / CBS 356.35 / IMI 108563 / JCM 9778 / NBRC 8474) TaxID=1097556 RepID=S0BE33_TAPDE|nr:Uncharacterized protein C824.03c, mitochondrial [Taphrina deformans PYCC 5710]|eukprot:CCG81313.1 Uncharacterized protein C824.03c, mitochondrial [Taphrina deformans PYCC 5710]
MWDTMLPRVAQLSTRRSGTIPISLKQGHQRAHISSDTTTKIKDRPTPNLKPKRKQSGQHDSLESFINHTSIQKSDLTSTVYRGTLFEYTVLEALAPLSFRIHRTGGADDKGVDLRGTWVFPDREPVPVVIQCKNETKKVGPRYIREMCGIPASPETVLVLASTSQYTPKALQFFMASQRPICLFVIESFDQGGTMKQLIWNNAASTTLSGLEVRAFHEKEEIRLRVMYNNKSLKPSKPRSSGDG